MKDLARFFEFFYSSDTPKSHLQPPYKSRLERSDFVLKSDLVFLLKTMVTSKKAYFLIALYFAEIEPPMCNISIPAETALRKTPGHLFHFPSWMTRFLKDSGHCITYI